MKPLLTSLLIMAVVTAAAQTKRPAAAAKPTAAPAEPINITIGESDVAPARPSQASKAASDTRAEAFRREVRKEIDAAESAAKSAATPDEGFPHHVKAMFLNSISDDYVKAQYAWASMPKDLFQALGEAKSPSDLDQLERTMSQSAEIFADLTQALSESPANIADELLRRNYDVATIKAKLPAILSNSPLPVFRERYQAMYEAAGAARAFFAEARRTWGKWIVRDGNLGLAEALSPSERLKVEQAAVAARSAMNKAKEAP